MNSYCESCGAALTPAARFCGQCGTPVPEKPAADAAAPPEADPLPPEQGEAEAAPLDEAAPVADAAPSAEEESGFSRFEEEQPPRSRWPLFAGVAAAVLAAGAAGAWFMGAFDTAPEVDPDLAEPEVAEVDEDAPLPTAWFAAYADEFLTGEVSRFVADGARKRDYPTSRGSAELSSLLPGAQVTGRFVRGADGESRWLKTDDGGYIWEGNLAEVAATPANPPFVIASQSCQGEMCSEYIGAGMRSERAVDLVADIGSNWVVGRLPSGRRVQPLDYRVEVRAFGTATVSCKEAQAYPMDDGAESLLQQGTALRLHYYLGEGYVAASRSPGSTANLLQIDAFCLEVTRDLEANDWIRLRLPDGTLGWAPIDNFVSVM